MFSFLAWLCNVYPSRVPADFQVRVSFSSVQPEPEEETRVDFIDIRQTDGRYRLIANLYNHGVNRSLSDEELTTIYNSLVDADVMRLRNSYFDPDILDGGVTSLFVQINGDTKEISMRNKAPEELDNFFEQLRHLTR